MTEEVQGPKISAWFDEVDPLLRRLSTIVTQSEGRRVALNGVALTAENLPEFVSAIDRLGAELEEIATGLLSAKARLVGLGALKGAIARGYEDVDAGRVTKANQRRRAR
jgi:hypothetical protein